MALPLKYARAPQSHIRSHTSPISIIKFDPGISPVARTKYMSSRRTKALLLPDPRTVRVHRLVSFHLGFNETGLDFPYEDCHGPIRVKLSCRLGYYPLTRSRRRLSVVMQNPDCAVLIVYTLKEPYTDNPLG